MSKNEVSTKNKKIIGKMDFPNDWSIYKLGDLLKLIKRPIKMEDERLYNLVTVKRRFGGMVERGRLFGNQIEVKSQFSIQLGDFVISKRQISHGACAIVPTSLDGSIVSNEYNVLRNKKELDLEFFSWYVQLPLMQRFFYLSSDGVHIEKLLFKTEDWLKRKVCIPDITEQKKIAKILSTWNKGIELKEKLVEQKKVQKKILMQKLLTGQVRIPGFAGEWKNFKLGDIIEDWSDGGTPAKNNPNYFGGDINWIVIDDIQRYIYSTRETLTTLGLEKCSSKYWDSGTVILSTGATIGEVGITKVKTATKQGITGIVPKDNILFNEYLRYWLDLNKSLLLRYAQGSSIKEIRTGTLGSLDITIPPYKEQIAISKILVSFDDELDLLQNEACNLKEQKKGLMQLLLTGKVRVKV